MRSGPPRSVVAAFAAVLAIVTAGACRHVPSPQEVQDSRTHAFDQAIARAQARFGGALISVDEVVIDRGDGDRYQPPEDDEVAGAPPRPQPVRVEQRITGQGDADVLYRLPSGRFALAAPTCLEGGSCGCDIAIDYRYLRRDDGRLAVVRLTPKVEVVEVKVESCGYGCGQPPQPRPLTAAALDVADPAQVEVIDESYRYVDVRRTCDHPIPAP